MPSPYPILDDPEKRRLFLDSIKGGNYREVACKVIGITRMTLNRYLKYDDDVSKQFKADIEAAESQIENKLVGSVIDMAEDGNFHAAQWYLATKFSTRWGNNTKELKEALKLLKEINANRQDNLSEDKAD